MALVEGSEDDSINRLHIAYILINWHSQLPLDLINYLCSKATQLPTDRPRRFKKKFYHENFIQISYNFLNKMCRFKSDISQNEVFFCHKHTTHTPKLVFQLYKLIYYVNNFFGHFHINIIQLFRCCFAASGKK